MAAPHEDASGVSASVKADARRRRRRAAAPAGDPVAAGRRGVRGGGAPGVHRARVRPGLAGPAAGHRAVGRELRRQRRPGGAALRARSAPRSPRACTGGAGLAVSLDSGWEIPEQPHWDAVAHVLPQVLDVLLAADEGTVLSVNVPDRPAAELGAAARGAARRGSAWRRSPCGTTTTSSAAVLRATAGDLATEPDPESDVALARRRTSHGDPPDVGGRRPGVIRAVRATHPPRM